MVNSSAFLMPMQVIYLFLRILFWLNLLLLVLGLWRPWVVLWWMASQNRLKVIQYYGSSLLVLLVLSWLIAGLAIMIGKP